MKHLIVFISVLLAALPAMGAERKPYLKTGVAPSEVVKLWGSPSDKEEHEIRRTVVWHYGKDDKVVFSEGRVVAVTQVETLDTSEVKKAEVVDPVAGSNKDIEVESDNLVRQIASEIPSGPDSPPGTEVIPPPENTPMNNVNTFPPQPVGVMPPQPNVVMQGMPLGEEDE